jgi:hypothetical protein
MRPFCNAYVSWHGKMWQLIHYNHITLVAPNYKTKFFSKRRMVEPILCLPSKPLLLYDLFDILKDATQYIWAQLISLSRYAWSIIKRAGNLSVEWQALIQSYSHLPTNTILHQLLSHPKYALSIAISISKGLKHACQESLHRKAFIFSLIRSNLTSIIYL